METTTESGFRYPTIFYLNEKLGKVIDVAKETCPVGFSVLPCNPFKEDFIYQEDSFGRRLGVHIKAKKEGDFTWDWSAYSVIAEHIFRAAIDQGTQIRWGGFFTGPVDGCYFYISQEDL